MLIVEDESRFDNQSPLAVYPVENPVDATIGDGGWILQEYRFDLRSLPGAIGIRIPEEAKGRLDQITVGEFLKAVERMDEKFSSVRTSSNYTVLGTYDLGKGIDAYQKGKRGQDLIDAQDQRELKPDDRLSEAMTRWKDKDYLVLCIGFYRHGG